MVNKILTTLLAAGTVATLAAGAVVPFAVSRYKEAPAVVVDSIKHKDGNIENILTVELTRNPDCRDLIDKHGDDKAYFLINKNTGRVIASYEQGGLIPQADLSIMLLYSWIGKDGKERHTYQIQSGANKATLKRLGNEILEKACSEVEQTQSVHQQLNPHTYGGSGVLKPRYAPRMLHL